MTPDPIEKTELVESLQRLTSAEQVLKYLFAVQLLVSVMGVAVIIMIVPKLSMIQALLNKVGIIEVKVAVIETKVATIEDKVAIIESKLDQIALRDSSLRGAIESLKNQ